MCTHKFTDNAIPNWKLSQLCEQIFTNCNFIFIPHHIIRQGKTQLHQYHSYQCMSVLGKMILLTFTYIIYVYGICFVVASND